ncbi:MAG TPA: hypothetical protein VNQ90_17880 [Chthoniobacteraceae bacterium]|nr:hypothetical protein [Chthoniobacteraceae bacterium]
MAYPDQPFPFTGGTSAFLENYYALIDAVKSWTPSPGIVIWGFLRDSHGGVEAARRLADYAAERGVSLIPGVGTSGYGGIYYEGEHPFSARTMMERYPELVVANRKVDELGAVERGATLNPLDPRVIEWLTEGIDWLLETFSIGGVNLELGDFFVAQDEHSIARRAEIDGVENEFFQMLALHYGELISGLIAKHPGREISYATYSDFPEEQLRRNAAFSHRIPAEAVCQWTLTRSQESTDRRDLLPKRNRGFAHLFSIANRTDQCDLSERVARLCEIASRSGFEGVGIYGEIGWHHNEYARRNYEAFQRYTATPGEAVSFC